MALNFTTCFTDAGKYLAAAINLMQFAGKTAPTAGAKWGTGGPVIKDQGTMYSDLETRLNGAGLTGLLASSQALPALLALDAALAQAKGALVTDLTNLLVTRVNNDVVQPNLSLQTAMVEFIRQMKAASSTVNASTVGSSVTAGGSNTGNATIVVGLVDQNGASLEYAIPETIVARCTSDRFSGATAGQEAVAYSGQAKPNGLSFNYYLNPGSGCAGSLTVIDPTQGNGSGGNLVSGGSASAGAFKSWNGSTPNGWVVDVDAANVSDGTSSNYSGTAHCLQFTGNTAGTNLQTSVYQNFANGGITSGNTTTLLPNTVYLFHAKIKASVVPAAGAITISLTDGSGNVISDNAGNANSIVSTCSGYGSTAYQTVTGTFRTPTVMPANVRLRVKCTTPVTTASNVFVDFVALSQPAQAYTGGPFLSVFRGSTDLSRWVNYSVGDTWNVAVTQSLFSIAAPSIQVMVNQLLNLAGMGLILPSSGSPSVADSLIA